MSEASTPQRAAPTDPRQADRAPTPTDRLAAVDAELVALDGLGLAAQVAAFDEMHSALTSALAATVDQPPRSDPVASGQPSLPYEDR